MVNKKASTYFLHYPSLWRLKRILRSCPLTQLNVAIGAPDSKYTEFDCLLYNRGFLSLERRQRERRESERGDPCRDVVHKPTPVDCECFCFDHSFVVSRRGEMGRKRPPVVGDGRSQLESKPCRTCTKVFDARMRQEARFRAGRARSSSTPTRSLSVSPVSPKNHHTQNVFPRRTRFDACGPSQP